LRTENLLKNNVDVLIIEGHLSDEATIDVANQSIAPCEIFHTTIVSSSIVANTGPVLFCGRVNLNNTALANYERFIS
jgi:hypothetical protein